MSAAAPWSVKGIDPKAREIAKDLARRSGMTLGEWLNSMIMEDSDDDEGVTPLPRRTPIPDPYDRRNRSRRLDDVYGAEDDGVRVGASLEIIAGRLEASERRSTVAIQGIDQAVAGLVRRMEGQDEIGLGYARRIDDIADELREGHKRLRRFEREVGPKTEEGVAKLDAALGAVSSRLFDLDERQRTTIGDLRERMEAVEKAAGPGPGADVMAQVGARLDEAQDRTSEALKGLERSFAALDLRLRDAEGRIEPEHAREAARFEKLAETLTREVDSSRVEMLRRLDVAETESRVDRIERALAGVGDQTRAAEQRSADAVEAMGREVLRIAQNLNTRVEKVETGGAATDQVEARLEAVGRELSDKLDRDMGRYTQAMDQRMTRSDDQNALALERLGGEITRISDRLGERIAQSERRSAQALDDIGRRLAENSDKIEQRYDRASGELGERMRQSEERTVRLLAEARDSIEQRGTRTGRRETPLESPEPTPWSPAESPSGDWRAAAFADPADDIWSDDTLGGLLDAAPFPTPTVRDPEPVFADPLDAELNAAASAEEVEAPAALFGSSPERARFGAVSTDLLDEAVESVFAEAGLGEAGHDDTGLAESDFVADDFGGADVRDVLVDDAFLDAVGGLPPLVDGPAEGDDGFSAEIDFIDPGALKAGAAAGRATTRDTLDAARAAMADADEAPRKGFGLKRGGKSKLQERLDKQASREGSTIRKAFGASAVAALVMGGGYASLQLAEGSGLILPDIATLTGGAASTTKADPAPIAAVALNATPTEAVPSPDIAAAEGAALYERGVQLIDNGDDSGLEALKRAANLGYGPAQMRLAGLYQDGGAGLTPDPVEARTWARRAAEGGEPRAMHYYAMQLYDGEGGARNRVEALSWLKKAAEAGRVDSQYNVARLYEKGDEGVAANATEAFKWYMIAARRGDQQALAAVQRLTPVTSADTRRVAREAADAFTVEPVA